MPLADNKYKFDLDDMKSEMYYTLNLCGLTRRLPLCRINEKLMIAAFNMLGDNELTEAAASSAYDLIKDVDFDMLVTAECKGIAFTQAVSRLFFERKAQKYFVVARKSHKLYMNEPVCVSVNSITTEKSQTLWLSGDESKKLKGKKVIIADDVISTGETARALRFLLGKVGAVVAGELCVLAEGDAFEREGIYYLKYLPIFDDVGTPIERRQQ
ncbi:MAG: adenine phosphoribosyltransferase [Clostridiales bacterium]|jgi:adenine phosphoribosyltransferase|nr:adenine phosphoribosyltransferase [Clostridiales bacterium]